MKLWHCRVCSWEGQTGDEVVAAFHSCLPQVNRDLSWVGSLPSNIEERRHVLFKLMLERVSER